MKILDASIDDEAFSTLDIEHIIFDLSNINYPLYEQLKNQPTDTMLLSGVANNLIRTFTVNNFDGVILPAGSPEFLWLLGRLWPISSMVTPFFIVFNEHTGSEIKQGVR